MELPVSVRSGGGRLNLGGSNQLCPVVGASGASYTPIPSTVSGKKGIRSGRAIPIASRGTGGASRVLLRIRRQKFVLIRSKPRHYWRGSESASGARDQHTEPRHYWRGPCRRTGRTAVTA